MTWSPEDYKEHVRALKEALGRPDPVGVDRFRSQGPGQLFVERDDQLMVRARGFPASAEAILIRARMLDPDGRITPYEFRLPGVTTTAVQAVGFFSMAEGWLLGVEALSLGTNTQVGTLYVQLDLARGPAASPIFVQSLAAGYVTDQVSIAWPGPYATPPMLEHGSFESIAGADPAAGAEISTQWPSARYSILHGVRAQLVTDATVANRRVHFQIFDGTVVVLDLAAADVQTASTTRNYNMENAGFARAAQDNEIYLPLPYPVPIRSAWTLRTVTTALAAGDNWGAPIYLVESFVRP